MKISHNEVHKPLLYDFMFAEIDEKLPFLRFYGTIL